MPSLQLQSNTAPTIKTAPLYRFRLFVCTRLGNDAPRWVEFQTIHATIASGALGAYVHANPEDMILRWESQCGEPVETETEAPADEYEVDSVPGLTSATYRAWSGKSCIGTFGQTLDGAWWVNPKSYRFAKLFSTPNQAQASLIQIHEIDEKKRRAESLAAVQKYSLAY